MALLIDTFNEKLFTIKEVAEHLRVSRETARLIVKGEPGVVRRNGPRNQRTRYLTPESVLRRIYYRMVIR